MHDELNGLKILILKNNSCANICSLLCALVSTNINCCCKNYIQIATFSSLVNSVINVVRVLCKQREVLRKK
jgi:hypothetical protein